MIDALIFSRNRSMQLNCLLSSLIENSNLLPEKITVLCRYDNEYQKGLEVVKSLHPKVSFIKEENFEKQVKDYIKFGEKFCVFFVDDILVKDSIDFSVPCSIINSNPDVLTFSLRLGTHLTECYPVAAKQPVPNGNITSQFFVWKWRESHYDWGYPMSVDGHIFRRSEFEGWSSHLRFNNPNQFESALQEIPRNFAVPQGMVSYLNSKILNNPANRVQDEFKNRSESLNSYEDLNNLWEEGFEIDHSKIRGYLNKAAHEPINFPMRKRT